MSVYHISYSEKSAEIRLFISGDCQFSCRGCITDWYPLDYHLKEKKYSPRHPAISIEKVLSILTELSKEKQIKKAIYLGKEPTMDRDFLPLAKMLKERFSTHNVFLTNGFEYAQDDFLDEVCVSVKAVSEKIFYDFTGQKCPEKVLENLWKYFHCSGYKMRTESIFIPGYIDLEEIEKIAIAIADINENIPYRIDGYIPPPDEKDREKISRKPSTEEMQEVAKIAKKHLKNVSCLHPKTNVSANTIRVY